jgi:Ca2+-binding RTX toxin-like protein
MATFGRLVRLAGAVLASLVLVSAFSAFAAANAVAKSRVADVRITINANALKPSQCASLNLTNVVTGRGDFNGTNNNDLILGSNISDEIYGRDGNDCILGGGGDDVIDGDSGNDILIGGSGDDDLKGGGGTDYCYGNSGSDSMSSCTELG